MILGRWAVRSVCMLTLCAGLPFRMKAEVAPAPAVPRGVFALIKSGAATKSSVLSTPDVDGISLRTGWDAVNPFEDRYDWSYFDTEIAKAKNAGKKKGCSVSQPDKTFQAGSQRHQRQLENLPLVFTRQTSRAANS